MWHILFSLRTAARHTQSDHHQLSGITRDQLTEAALREPIFGAIAEGFITVHSTLCTAAAAIDEELREIAKGSALTRRLMTIPGVGPIVALNFIAVIDNADRFQKTSNVGAFLGLTPRRYQSGEMDYSGRISKCGDAVMRGLLFEAATSLKRWSCIFDQLAAKIR